MAIFTVRPVLDGIEITGWAVHRESIVDAPKTVAQFKTAAEAEAEASRRRKADTRRETFKWP